MCLFAHAVMLFRGRFCLMVFTAHLRTRQVLQVTEASWEMASKERIFLFICSTRAPYWRIFVGSGGASWFFGQWLRVLQGRRGLFSGRLFFFHNGFLLQELILYGLLHVSAVLVGMLFCSFPRDERDFNVGVGYLVIVFLSALLQAKLYKIIGQEHLGDSSESTIHWLRQVEWALTSRVPTWTLGHNLDYSILQLRFQLRFRSISSWCMVGAFSALRLCDHRGCESLFSCDRIAFGKTKNIIILSRRGAALQWPWRFLTLFGKMASSKTKSLQGLPPEISKFQDMKVTILLHHSYRPTPWGHTNIDI